MTKNKSNVLFVLAALTLTGCGGGTPSTSVAPKGIEWVEDTATYHFADVPVFEGASELPSIDHVVAFCPVSSGYDTCYAWGRNGEGTYLGNWPGTAMSEKHGENWYKVEFPTLTETNIIFNKNGSPQTQDMSITGPGYWWFWGSDQSMHNDVPAAAWIDACKFIDDNTISVVSSTEIESFTLFEGETSILTGTPNKQAIKINLNDHALDFNSEYRVEAQLKKGTGKLSSKVSINKLFDSEAFNNEFEYKGDDLGVTYRSTKTTFKVWSPFSSKIRVKIYDNGTPTYISAEKGSDAVAQVVDMAKGEKGVWSATIEGDLNGKYYTYEVTNGEFTETEVVDPYARAVGVNGKRGMILDLASTNPEGWDSVEVHKYDRKELTVWETHIADLTSSSTWGGNAEDAKKYSGFHASGTSYTKDGVTVKTGFDHVKELGVNAVQILPMFDQDNNELVSEFNWGYNPLNYNAPDGIYSKNPYDGAERIKELKSLIADYSNAGINIIMDVVYNHVAGAKNSNFDVLMPGYYFRYNENGSFANGSGCGNETASDHAMMRKFMIDSTTYWAKEYKLGGFRFDLMGLHDLETMNKLTAAVKEVSPYSVIYGEPWQGGTSPLAGDKTCNQINGNKYEGYGQFNDGMRDALIKGGLNAATNVGWVTDFDEAKAPEVKTIIAGLKGITEGSATIADPDKTVNYVTCHDNYTLYDRVVAAIGRYDKRWTEPMTMLANSVVFTSQGTTFMLAGEEMIRTKGGNENSYNASYKVNELDYSRKITYSKYFENYKKLIALKQDLSCLHLGKGQVESLDITSKGNNEIIMNLHDSDTNKDYRIVHCNGYGDLANVDFSGYELLIDTKGTGVTLSESTPMAAYQTIVAVR